MHSRVFQLLLYSTHMLLYFWNAVVAIIWRLNGTSKRIFETMNADTENPAQVLRIVWKNPYAMVINPKTYFTVHERFAPVDIVLNRRIHLFSVNSKKAAFVELNCDLFNVKAHPLNFLTQTNHAIRLIILPIKAFNELVDSIDVGDRNVVWMFHTTRCGSTAWVQVFNSLPGWTVYSEPLAMMYSIAFGDHGYSSAESFSKSPIFTRLAVSVIKLYIRQAPKGGSVFWKAMAYEEYLIETIANYFPHHKMLAAYRESFPSITSFYRTFNNSCYIRYVWKISLNHDPYDDKFWFDISNLNCWTNGYDHEFCKKLIISVRPKTALEWYCFMWAAKTALIKRAVEAGVNIQAIKYDSLLENRRATIAKVFDYLSINSDLLGTACKVLDYDSQAGVANASWDTRKQAGGTEWSKDKNMVKRCEMILKAFGLPKLHSELGFPNTF
ncbi:uncharacterized protein [Watersipora subatra]|uniref:uncharacterized protein n=1 Tax=Watersipora subatra TaxID=2589382 RepID=UPI00355C4BE1